MCEQDRAPIEDSHAFSRRGFMVGAGTLIGAVMLGGEQAFANSKILELGALRRNELESGLLYYPRSAWAVPDAQSDYVPLTQLSGAELESRLVSQRQRDRVEADKVPTDVKFFEVHHSAVANNKPPTDTDAPDYQTRYGQYLTKVVNEIKAGYRLCVSAEKNMTDIFYNVLIAAGGEIIEGRDGGMTKPVKPDASIGRTGHSLKVCLLGDFTTEMPTDAALTSLTAVLHEWSTVYGVDISPGTLLGYDGSVLKSEESTGKIKAGTVLNDLEIHTISPHKATHATECPGDTFTPYVVNELPKRVASYKPQKAAGQASTPASAPVTSKPAVPGSVPVNQGAASAAPTGKNKNVHEPFDYHGEYVIPGLLGVSGVIAGIQWLRNRGTRTSGN